MKQCSHCGVVDDGDQDLFYDPKKDSWCKECKRALCRKYYRDNRKQQIARAIKRHKETEYGHKTYMQKLYELSPQDEKELLRLQDGVCAICKRDSPGRKDKNWAVDHDHKTKRPRGLLCFGYNTTLGYAKDSPTILRRAAEYLEVPPFDLINMPESIQEGLR